MSGWGPFFSFFFNLKKFFKFFFWGRWLSLPSSFLWPPFFSSSMGALLPVGVSLPPILVCRSFPSPRTGSRFYFPFCPLFSAAIQAGCQSRPTSSLASKSKARCDVLYRMWCPFLEVWYVSSSGALSSFSNSFFWWFSCPSASLLAPSPPPVASVWVLEVDPLSTFHLDLPQPRLYLWILFTL